jgi:dTDP-4-dehydrorhamnose reductase
VSGWLVTGAGGMLGQDIVTVLERAGESAAGLTHRDLDITDGAAVNAAVANHRPDVVVNCAAWTAVDEAEAHEQAALHVNGEGAAKVAAACARTGARLVQMSTDYVFGGNARQPYTEDAQAEPRTSYGRTKLAGEKAVLRLHPQGSYIVRTAWLYGAQGPNFVHSIIRLERERLTIDVVDDQRGQPTWTVDVALQLIALVRSLAAPGVYHATSSGDTTWFGLAREVFRLLGTDEGRVRPVGSVDFPRPAPRPAYSVLGHAAWLRAGIEPISSWRHALHRAFPLLAASSRPSAR